MKVKAFNYLGAFIFALMYFFLFYLKLTYFVMRGSNHDFYELLMMVLTSVVILFVFFIMFFIIVTSILFHLN